MSRPWTCDEKREDTSAEDGLRQASTVFGEDPDVWLLLGIYAERSADPERALAAYDRAMRAGPDDYRAGLEPRKRPLRGGELCAGDSRLRGGGGESPGRSRGLLQPRARARRGLRLRMGRRRRCSGLAGSRRATSLTGRTIRLSLGSFPSSYPSLAPGARSRSGTGSRKGAACRAMLPPPAWSRRSSLRSPPAPGLCFVLALTLRLLRTWRGMAKECVRCGEPHCKYCRRYGDPLGLCSACSRQRKASRGIDIQVKRAEQARLLAQRRKWLCRFLSFLFPGSSPVLLEESGFRFSDAPSLFLPAGVRHHQQPALQPAAARAGERVDGCLARARLPPPHSSGRRRSGLPGGGRMGLEGTLAAFSVTDIFQALSLQKKTGTLTVESRDDTIKISFLGGQIVSADSASRGLEESIGTLLVRSGRLAAEDLLRVRESTERDSAAPGPSARPAEVSLVRGPPRSSAAPDRPDHLRRLSLHGGTLPLSPGGRHRAGRSSASRSRPTRS